MWLINTGTLELEYHMSAPGGMYAILSHRWRAEEVSFDEYRAVHGQSWERGTAEQTHSIVSKQGYKKIRSFCSYARMERHALVWVDTCCIDKRSSAELTEAINSMWNWYSGSSLCIVYLDDVPTKTMGDKAVADAFRRSEWFTRCWTLQELLAPRNLSFNNCDWQRFRGLWKTQRSPTRESQRATDHSSDRLLVELRSITGIPEEVLSESYYPDDPRLCVAQRMSWAARRKATRVEDVAYSLLGLFGVNIPLIYGEGPRAFFRLQKEIIQTSNDESIFAWKDEECECERVHVSSQAAREVCSNCDWWSTCLADSPYRFRASGRVRPYKTVRRRPYFTTNQGLEFRAEAVRTYLKKWSDRAILYCTTLFVIDLNCSEVTDDEIDSSNRSQQPCRLALYSTKGVASSGGGPDKQWFDDQWLEGECAQYKRCFGKTLYPQLPQWSAFACDPGDDRLSRVFYLR